MPSAVEKGEDISAFEQTIPRPIVAAGIEVLQVNLGYRCNLSCKHCHVNGGPRNEAVMPRRILERVLEVARSGEIPSIDLTGGAPEMNPDFRWFLRECAGLGRRLSVRSNLAILLEEGYRDIPDLYRELGVEVIASLPAAQSSKSDRQRGEGVFDRVIDVMRLLNSLGYARPDTGLRLNLVHNPTGAYLPGSQASLEREYHERLRSDHGVSFNELYCVTNMPIGRYREFLERTGNYEEYMRTLRAAFNPAALDSAMCRTTLSVGWDGRVYDCDFNQILGMAVDHGAPSSIMDFDMAKLAGRTVVVGDHCFGCAAGAGSSCRGRIV